MKLKLTTAAAVAAILAGFSAVAQQFTPTPDLSNAPDEKKISYALGMNLALQIKHSGADVDVNTILKALNDVLQDRPTQLQPAQLPQVFQQMEAVQFARISARDMAEGDAFLAKNARAQGVTVLPDGLQYRVLQAGGGATPKSGDTVTLSFRGTLLDGAQFEHADHLETPVAAQIKGCQEALRLMKAGSKWQIFLPPSLAYGQRKMRHINPDSTVIFELELFSIKPAPAGK